MDLLLDQARREPLEAQQQVKAQEQLQRYFFTKKAEKFVHLWGEFTTKLQSGTFDAKLAHKLSKAFRDLNLENLR